MGLVGKIRTTVAGLLKSVYGITYSGTQVVVGSVASLLLRASSQIDFQNLSASSVVRVDATNGNVTSIGSYYMGSSVSAGDAGIGRLAAGVVREATGGWIQNTAGCARVTGDGTNITITPATTGLSVTVKASRHYSFKLVLFVEETTAADGLRVDFNGGTATMTDFRVHGTVADTAGVRSLTQSVALDTDITDTTTTGASMAVFEGHFTVNAAGTFIPRYAKEADAAGAALNLRRGSYLLVEDVP